MTLTGVLVLVGVAGTAVAAKALAPVSESVWRQAAKVTGSRTAVVPAALFAALLVTQLLVRDGRLHAGPPLAGVVVAAALAILRAPLLLAVAAAVAVTALLRLLT